MHKINITKHNTIKRRSNITSKTHLAIRVLVTTITTSNKIYRNQYLKRQIKLASQS